MNVYVWILTFSLFFTIVRSKDCRNEQKCKISRIHNMKGADCFKKDMREFPKCLASDVEIIDLSYNRIRKLAADDLKRYSYLKMLYLSDNYIGFIDEETFEGINELNTLDLSLNGISKLPSVVFHLPSLKSLYLGQNLNMNIVDVVEEAKPISSPLVQLDISYIMSEEANKLPELGILPYLTKYNISGNKLLDITTKNFAGLCSLKLLDTTNVSSEFVKPCDCWTINRWLKSRKVLFKPFQCEIFETDCLDGVPIEDQQMYESCNEKIEKMNQQARLMKILIPIIVSSIIIFNGGGFYVYRKRKNQKLNQNQKLDEAEEPVLYNNLTKT